MFSLLFTLALSNPTSTVAVNASALIPPAPTATLVSTDARPARPVLRVLVEVGSGILAVGASTGIGIGISRATCSDCSFAGLGGAIVGFGSGLALAPLAVWGGGQLVDGRSHLGGAYLGALGGYALAAGTLALGARGDSDSFAFRAAWIAASLFAVAGPVVGSELLSQPTDTTRAAWMPTAWGDGRGAWGLGVAGRFD